MINLAGKGGKAAKAARRISLALCAAVACLFALPLGGCKPATPVQSVNLEIEPTPAPQRVYPQGDLAALSIERDYMEYEEGYVLYPKVLSGENAEKINRAICDAVCERARELGAQVFTEYRIEHNNDGIFSIVLYIRNLHTDVLLAQLPLTFDCASGMLCEVGYYFNAQDERWRGALASLAAAKLEEQGVPLINTPEPVTDDRPYYITEDGLVLQYRLYEISTYAAGYPEIEIPVAELGAYLAPGSPLLRLLGE